MLHKRLLGSGRGVLGTLKSQEANPSGLGSVAFKGSGIDFAISKQSWLWQPRSSDIQELKKKAKKWRKVEMGLQAAGKA